MDLDSRAYSKLIDAWNTHGGSEDYRRILERLGPLTKRHDHETPEMWCSHIRDPVIVKSTVIHQIMYIVVYATPWYLYLKSIQDVLITIKITI